MHQLKQYLEGSGLPFGHLLASTTNTTKLQTYSDLKIAWTPMQISVIDVWRIAIFSHIIQIYPGITRGRVLKGEFYAQRLQKLIYLYLFTDCFMKISLHEKFVLMTG